jgi:heat shock protein HslJ
VTSLRFIAVLVGIVAVAAIGGPAWGDGQAASTPPPLEGTTWKLIDVGGAPAVVLPEDRQAHLLLTAAGRKLAGSTGCNRLAGSYETSAQGLRFGAIASTKMACAEPLMKQEQALAAALQTTTRYRVDGRTLELRDGERVLARLEAR